MEKVRVGHICSFTATSDEDVWICGCDVERGLFFLQRFNPPRHHPNINMRSREQHEVWQKVTALLNPTFARTSQVNLHSSALRTLENKELDGSLDRQRRHDH
jgi:hypothetical protein